MSVVNTDLVIYTSVNMPEGNTTIAGGDINSGIRASYDDPSSPNQIVVYSSSASDTSQSLTLFGRTAAGIDINESLSLNGTVNVTTSFIYERILKANLSDVAVGIITVSGNSVNKIADIPIGESGFRRPFYDATASADVTKTYYEKIFVKNNNTTSALTEAKVIPVNSGLASKIEFGLENNKKADQSISNREAVPTGIAGGFGSGSSGIVDSELLAGDYQGIWCKLSLEAGESAINSFYEIQISGTTV